MATPSRRALPLTPRAGWRRLVRRLGSPWVIGAIGLAVVAGVAIGFVIGIDAALDERDRAEEAEHVVVLSEPLVETMSLLLEERGLATLYTATGLDVHAAGYRSATDETDAAVAELSSLWGSSPITDDEALSGMLEPLQELPNIRASVLDDPGSGSPLELYAGLISPLRQELGELMAREAVAGLAAGDALLELVAAVEAAGVRSAVGTRILGRGEPMTREDEVLMRVESRRLEGRVDAVSLSLDPKFPDLTTELQSSDAYQRAEALVEQMFDDGDSGEYRISSSEWFDAASAQIDQMRALERVFTGELEATAAGTADDAQQQLVLTGVLVGALLFMTLVASWGAVSTSRDRLTALRQHTRLVERLRVWFVPRALPSVPGMNVEVRYLPMPGGVAAGGDWYDVIEQRDGSIGFVIGDVTGHGPDAVARMAELKNMLRGIATASDMGPAGQLMQLDRMAPTSRLLATVCYMILDASSASLHYCRAGHLPPLVRRARGAVEILDGAGGPPLGVDPTVERIDERVEMARGSALLMFTDGLVEKPGGDVSQAVRQVARVFEIHGNNLDDLADLLVAMRPQRPQVDDLSLLIVHWAGG